MRKGKGLVKKLIGGDNLEIEVGQYMLYFFILAFATVMLLDGARVFSAIGYKVGGDYFLMYIIFLIPVLVLWHKIDKKHTLRGRKKFIVKTTIALIAIMLWSIAVL